jgi:CelD/BcsL family acetyltransferase involved in cellulose biosynthesis
MTTDASSLPTPPLPLDEGGREVGVITPRPDSPPTRLVELDPADTAWTDFVAATPAATVFHHPAWLSALVAAYGYRPLVLAEQDADGRVSAGLPLIRVRRLSGRAWVSLPFTDFCPPLARDEVSMGRLAEDLAAWSGRRGVPVEVRGELPATPTWNGATVGTRHVLPLDRGIDAAWACVRESIRRQVRGARRAGLEVRFTRRREDMDAFYRLQLATRRRLGVPVQPRRFIEALWRHVIEPGFGVVALAETPAGEAVATSLMLAWNGTAIEKFQASDAAHWQTKPNQLVIWATIEWSFEQGALAFDFGRSDAGHTGLQRFKAAWGAEELPLRYAVAGGASARAAGDSRIGGLLGKVIRRSPDLVCRALGRALYRFAA